MNFATLLVQIVSTPEQCFFSGDISLLKMQVEFTRYKKNKGFPCRFEIYMWGFLGPLFLKYYTVGDYIIIEGIFSFKKSNSGSPYQKDTRFAVTDFYPFLLSELDEEEKTFETTEVFAAKPLLEKEFLGENQRLPESIPWLTTEKALKANEELKAKEVKKESLQVEATKTKEKKKSVKTKPGTKKTKHVNAEELANVKSLVKKTANAQGLSQSKKN